MDENLWEDRLDNADLDFPQLEEQPFDEELNSLSLDAQGLVNLGYLTEDVQLGGNEIVLRTLYVGEELEVGLLTQQYKGTDAEGQAWQTAMVAAAIERVNGKPIVTRLGPSDKDYLQRKFEFVKANYFWPVIRQVFEDGMVPLLRRQATAVEELRSKSPAIRPTSSPSSESQTERDSSKVT